MASRSDPSAKVAKHQAKKQKAVDADSSSDSDSGGFASQQPPFNLDFQPSQQKKPRSLFSLNNQTFISAPSDKLRTPSPNISTSTSTNPPLYCFSDTSASFTEMKDSMKKLKLGAPAPAGLASQTSLGTGSASSLCRVGKGGNRVHTPSGDDYDDSESVTGEEFSEDDSANSSEDDSSGAAIDEHGRLESHLQLLERRDDLDELNELSTAPIFTESVRKHALSVAGNAKNQPFTQFGLLAGDATRPSGTAQADPRIFYNVSAPSSVFICGSQGSGKSHSLSCLLENCLIPSKANTLPRPLTGIVFHFDTFISDSGGSPCEAAWLSSSRDVDVRVLCAPTNVSTIKRLYRRFPNIKVEELRVSESDLNTKRMLDLMAVTSGSMPLYLHVINRILRDLRIAQQTTGKGFDYTAFKRMVSEETMTREQLAPLKQRLETLESFMVEDEAKAFDIWSSPQRGNYKKPKKYGTPGTNWTPKSGQLTIVDLSCPCVTPEMACSLFNICLSLFLEAPSTIGRVIALDEAHKYMNGSPECQTLTESLLATIRLQRHLGARIIISTQEPTISPKLLDLCSVTIVHRFTSPDWLAALRKHLAGVSAVPCRTPQQAAAAAAKPRVDDSSDSSEADSSEMDSDGNDSGSGSDSSADASSIGTVSLGGENPSAELFAQIVDLRVGEALVFAPGAIVGVSRRRSGGQTTAAATAAAGTGVVVSRLGNGVLKVRVRRRITDDGGRSVMAS